MMELLYKLTDYNSIAIIGMDKNVGKTTTLNAMITKARGKYILGLTSIGRDGEEKDLVTGTDKPRIYVTRNTFIATARRCLKGSDITMEIIETTDIKTPMGEVVIIRALSDGYIELAGPSVNSCVKDVCLRLKKLGSDFVICDGAISRKTFASPTITDATILCTGASVSKDMYKVVNDTLHTINLLSIKKIRDHQLGRLMGELGDCKVSIIDQDYTIKKLPILTALEAAGEILQNLDVHSKYIVIKGIISDRLLLGIMRGSDQHKDLTLVIEDGTKLFVSQEVYSLFIKSGGRIEALHEVNLIGVTVNPVSPYGYIFDKDRFMALMSKSTDLPVYNVYN